MKKTTPAFALLLLGACVPSPAVEPISPNASSPVDARQMRQRSLALLPVLDADAGPARNLFYSPASVEQAFGLLHLGAEGETRAQIERVLSPPRDLAGLANDEDGVEVRFANALWLSDAFRFRHDFIANAQQRYGATAGRLDFDRPALVADTVNDWAAKATEGLIDSVLTPESVTPDAVAFLTNALYFDGLWRTPFDSTEDRPFLFGDGQDRTFRLMRQVMIVPLVESGGLVAVRLPYRNERYAMDVIISEQRVIMPATPDPAVLSAIGEKLGKAEPRLVEVRLPQFEIDYRVGLIPALQAIGLTLPFDRSRADLSAMAEPGQLPLAVDDVQHVAKLQVFDTGTRAAAATSVRIVLVGARVYRDPPVPFTADRPFAAVIRDLKRDEVLFVGRIANPQPFTPRTEEP